MKRTPLRRSPLASRAKALSSGSPRSHADALLEKLGQTLYSFPEWGLVTEVRNHAGPGAPEVLRRADGLARNFYPLGGRSRIHFFEVKIDRWDWTRELKNPQKRGPFELCCSACYLVVPAPYKRVILTTRELPNRWGLIEVGTGDPVRVVVAEERDAEPPTPAFELAMFRAALARRDRVEAFGEAPLSPVVRLISNTQAQLGCGHLALSPLFKGVPRALPCFSCAAGLPIDRAIVRAAIEDATPDECAEWRALLDEREGKPPCGCPDPDPFHCAKERMLAMAWEPDEAADVAIRVGGCRCACHGRDEAAITRKELGDG
jgi:hypothetical protein